MIREIAEPVVAAGGRFYPAKDVALPGELYRASFHDGAARGLCRPQAAGRSGWAL